METIPQSATGEPLVSVVIPTYNRLHGLAELLESLVRQTFTDFEVIVVNDCGESVKSVIAMYPELSVRLIDLPDNRKHVHARNEGVKQAAGELILLCDDDDLLLPSHLARMVRELEGYDLVYSDVEIFDYRLEGRTRIPTSRRLFAYRYDPEAMRKFSTFVPSGILYRKSIHETLGPFDPDVYHYWDWDFYLRAAAEFRVKRVPAATVLYAFSQQGGNMSSDLDGMRHYLDKLSVKHNLGALPTKNFFLLLEEPDVRSRQADSEREWDGLPIISRYALHED